jgi:UDP-2,3-diacylglucosamine pyrophosphatase LpxH
MPPSLLASSDWHLADGSGADDFCEDGGRFVIEEVCFRKPDVFAWVGDILDCWVTSAAHIIEAHSAFLQWVDAKLSASGVPLWYFRGNHEPIDFETHVATLRTVMTQTTIVPFMDTVVWEGWTLMHGHQLDPTCHGKFAALASVLTGCAGLLERIIPGFESSMIDPTNLWSPHRKKNPALQNAIREAGDKYVREHGGRLLYGHTHRRRIALDRLVVNDGTCQGKHKGELAVIYPDGNSVIMEMMPEPYEE